MKNALGVVWFEFVGITLLAALVVGLTSVGLAQAQRVEFREPTTGMMFVFVPGGSYEQGCGSWTSDCKDHEKPLRQVKLSPFWIGEFEVTVGQFSQFVSETDYRTHAEKTGGCWVYDGHWTKKSGASFRSPGFAQSDNHPAGCVSWDDAQAFANWLSDKTGKRYRLPTEAQWEYACRSAGKPVAYGTDSGSISHDNANYDHHENKTTPAGHYAANTLGVQDMSGNVWEWTQDIYSDSAYQSGSGSTDPVNAGTSGNRVVRGGSWSHKPRDARCSNRDSRSPVYHVSYLGFRLVRTD